MPSVFSTSFIFNCSVVTSFRNFTAVLGEFSPWLGPEWVLTHTRKQVKKSKPLLSVLLLTPSSTPLSLLLHPVQMHCSSTTCHFLPVVVYHLFAVKKKSSRRAGEKTSEIDTRGGVVTPAVFHSLSHSVWVLWPAGSSSSELNWGRKVLDFIKCIVNNREASNLFFFFCIVNSFWFTKLISLSFFSQPNCVHLYPCFCFLFQHTHRVQVYLFVFLRG